MLRLQETHGVVRAVLDAFSAGLNSSVVDKTEARQQRYRRHSDRRIGARADDDSDRRRRKS